MLSHWKALVSHKDDGDSGEQQAHASITAYSPQESKNSRRIAVSRSRKGDQADGRVFNDPYAQASATMYGKISRAAFHVAQHSALQRPGSREQAPGADDLWESPGAARRGSASSSLTGTAHKAEQETSADVSEGEDEEEPVDAAALLNSREAEAPPFLQTQNAGQFTLQNADEVAELVAAAPGPLGQELAAEDWYDAVIHGYLASAWKAHAQQMVQDLRSVVTVLDGKHTAALEQVGKIEHFDLTKLRAIANNLVGSSKQNVLKFMKLVRKREHEFSVVVVQTVRSTYKRGFLSTLKGKNKEQQRALKQQRDMYEGKLETIRGASSAAERSAQADTSRAHAEASAFRDKEPSFRKELTEASSQYPALMQIKQELAQISPGISSNSEDEILQVMSEVVAACSTQKATAQAWQSKFQAAAVDIDRLTGDLKRAQAEIARLKEREALAAAEDAE